MGRLDLPDPSREWLSVSRQYLAELYQTIADLKAELARLRSSARDGRDAS